jgi:hypothetical protein
MVVFDHPQPALLFLVPGCTLSILILALIRGKSELNFLFNYEQNANVVMVEKKD